jgi:aliphatic nitrilase
MERLTFYKAASVHASPVYLDLDATVEKACMLIEEASANGAKLIVFPEAYIPGYPYWIWTHTPRNGAPLFAKLFKNAVEIPGTATNKLGAAAKRAGSFVVMGMSERSGGSLYNTLLYFDDHGEIIGKHRKLQPTMAERIIWGRGDGANLKVYDTPLGKIGGLICWEHTMDLARFALISQGEEVHISAYPGISALKHDPQSGIFDNVADAAIRHHALCAQCFVICAMTPIAQDTLEAVGLADQPDMMRTGGGMSGIVGPNGQYIIGPHKGSEEKILYADIDQDERIFIKYACDPIGHYGRPDALRLKFNNSPQPCVESFELFEADTDLQPESAICRED